MPLVAAKICVDDGDGVGGSFGSLRPLRPMRHEKIADLDCTYLVRLSADMECPGCVRCGAEACRIFILRA